MDLQITISPAVRATFPGLEILGLLCQLPDAGLTAPCLPNSLWEQLAGADLATHPRIAIWRDAIRLMGLKASEHRSSVEQLVRRFSRGAPPITNVPVVDTYNLASTTHFAPLGAYAIDRMPQTRVDLRHLSRSDHFEPLGGKASDYPLEPRIVGYTCGSQVLSWALNVRDNADTAIDNQTRGFVVFSEALDRRGLDASRSALADVKAAVVRDGGTAVELRSESPGM